MSTAQHLIEQFQLQPHPEGGYFREIYRADSEVTSPVKQQPRSAVTHIYFLLPAGEISRLHRVSHDEIWHYYAGAPIRLIDLQETTSGTVNVDEVIIGPEQADFTYVMRGGHYQAAQSTGDYTLVGCTVAPGFDFSDFNFVESAPLKAQILASHPELERFL